ncbi:hypothetical protein DK842_17770 [Chromobacterium phragmitis]|uniref:hypothetical protein n=1 Tax=Chromobacterium phragmitis TaxID=2202141 RepID=UPI000DED3545|nr:hypothetical protein [Chromobacterium phragmitis]AXE31585.1 hypothetical protein DK842_17770 [Chromobacterium phragmitis]
MNPLIKLAEAVEEAARSNVSLECMSIAITALVAGAKLAAQQQQWLLHDNITTMQSAWIEWKHGQGAAAAMEWIENTLSDPGLIPDEDELNSQNAQAWHDANCSRALKQQQEAA